MVKVQKRNKQLCIQDEKLEDYIERGYNQISENGEVIRIGKSLTIENLANENKELKAENELLKKENETLKAMQKTRK